jgi:hypothetical protein
MVNEIGTDETSSASDQNIFHNGLPRPVHIMVVITIQTIHYNVLLFLPYQPALNIFWKCEI